MKYIFLIAPMPYVIVKLKHPYGADISCIYHGENFDDGIYEVERTYQEFKWDYDHEYTKVSEQLIAKDGMPSGDVLIVLKISDIA